MARFMFSKKTMFKPLLLLVVSLILCGCDNNAIDAASTTSESKRVDSQSLIKEKIIEQNARIEAAREKYNKEVPWNLNIFVENLTEGLEEKEARIALFKFVMEQPYKIRSWHSRSGVELFDTGNGDCRHKREALYYLFKSAGLEVRKVTVLYNYADLPIPPEILNLISETRDFHSGMEIKINGEYVYVDPTWDSGLAKVGFPVNSDWDGESPTRAITGGETVTIPHSDYNNISELYNKYGVRWPRRSEQNKFVRALNSWLDDIRSTKQN
ncbi:transglutaminase domain-containing protein [Deltaproteobacteria bacterium IMCC39524]|nr:transglutaminase domain-containing protein [Deltaproteobacteria bacterium IMCC39524]